MTPRNARIPSPRAVLFLRRVRRSRERASLACAELESFLARIAAKDRDARDPAR